MGLFSPYALQAGFEGADLATQLRVKQLQEMAARQKLSDEDKARQARALIGRVLQQAGVVDPNAIPTSPAPGQASVPMQRPGAAPAMPAAPQVPTGDDTGEAATAAVGQGGAPAPAPTPQQAPTPARAPQLSWQQVAEEVRKRTDAPPEVIYAAMQQIMPELENESNRTARADLARAQIDQKNQALMQTLQWRYVNSADNVEREQIKADMKRLTTQMTNQSREGIAAGNNASREGIAAGQNASRENVANIGADSRRDVAGTNAGAKVYTSELTNSTRQNIADQNAKIQQRKLELMDRGLDEKAADRQARVDIANINADNRETVQSMRGQTARDIADMNTQSRQDIAREQNDLRRELGERKLDINQMQVEDTRAYKDRYATYLENNMSKKDAQFYAKLDVTRQLAEMRDGTTRRGQDMVSADKQAAASGKLDLARGKAANATDAAVQRINEFITDANKVIAHPGLDQATGAIAGALPSVRKDSVNFDAALDSLRSEKGLAVLQSLKDASATGGSGFSRVTNFELQQLQNSMGSLKGRQDGDTLRENLRSVIDAMSRSKARILKGYQNTYGKAVGSPGGVPTSSVAPKSGGETRPLPPELAVQPDGTPIRDKSSGKTFIKRGNQLVETGG